MKLSSSQVERTLHQFHAQALPGDHPSVPELKRVFGDHTFFVDGAGLHVVEPAEAEDGMAETGCIVKVASWQDANFSRLEAHKPEFSDVIVDLGPGGSERPH